MAFSQKTLFDYSVLPPEKRLKKAREYLFWILAKRNYPRMTLEEKLRARKLPSQDIEKLLDEMIEKKFFDPTAYLNSRVRTLLSRGYTPIGISRKLREERIRIDTSCIEEILSKEKVDLKFEKERFLEKCFSQHHLDFSLSNQETMMAIKKIINKAARKGYTSSDVWNFREKLLNNDS